MKRPFKLVTKKLLKTMTIRWYGGGKEIKVGDKIIYGYGNCYSSVYGYPNTTLRRVPPLYLTPFVLPKDDTMIYQLYIKSIDFEN